MPIYKYKCQNSDCGLKFDNLVAMDKRDEQKCSCGSEAKREGFEGFSVSTPLDLGRQTPYTEKEIDKVIGADAEHKWKEIEEKRKKRIEGKDIIEVDVKPGEKFNPEALLGSKDDRKRAEIYSEAVQEDRQKKRSRGEDPNNWDKSGFKPTKL